MIGAVTRILFVPGFMQRADAWTPVAELLPAEVECDLLDHGEHTFEGRMAEIAVGGEGAVLCGYSLGGRLVLRAALRDSERYRAVVTIGATAGLEQPVERSTRADADERLAAWIEAASIEDVVGVWERQPLFADQPEPLVEAQRPGRLSHDPRALALLLRTAGQGALEPVWHDLERLAPPLIAIAGTRDEAYARAAQRMADLAPRGRAALVEDAGHAPHLQRPGEVAGLLREHIALL